MDNTLTQGQNFTDTAGRTGIVNFDPKTGNRLALGASTSVPTTLNGVDVIKNPQSFQVPQISNPNDALTNAITGIATSVTNAQAKDTSAETTSNQGNDTLVNLMQQLGGQTGDTNAAEASVGLPTMNKDLSDLQTLQTQQLAGYINNINKNDNAAGFGDSPNLMDAKIQRQHGIDALLTSSLIQAKQGNIQAAQATVDRAIAAKYDPIKNAINVQNTIIAQNRDNLSRADKKLADEKTMQNNLMLKQIDQSIDNEKQLKDLVTTAAKYQAPNSILNKLNAISESGDPQAYFKAVQLAAPYLTDPIDRSYKIAQTQKLLADARAANTGDPMETLAYAQQYQSTGKIPVGLPKGTFGSVAQLAKDLPLQPGQIIQTNTGITPGTDNTLSNAMSALYSATELAKQLKILDDQRIGGLVGGTLGKLTGSSSQQRYVDLRAQIVDLLARARSGAAINDTELKQYESMLPSRFSEPLFLGAQSGNRIDNFVNNLSSDLKNKASSNGWAIAGLSTVKVGNQEYKVGDVVSNGGNPPIYGRVNADGSFTLVQ